MQQIFFGDSENNVSKMLGSVNTKVPVLHDIAVLSFNSL
jgi:hypothetical protein